MIFRQIPHDDLGWASYLIGDDKAGCAAVADPRFEVDEYLAPARHPGVGIEHVLETRNHADHVSGHDRLAAATGATIHIHREARPSYEHAPFDDGAAWEIGALRHDIGRIPEGPDRDRPIVVVCASGERAAMAGSLVARHVVHVPAGGVPTRGRLGHLIETG